MTRLSIIIPCYNEEEALPQLFEKLRSLEKQITDLPEMAVEFVFVDDGSSDNTFAMLNEQASGMKETKVVRHEVNRNLGAAMKTGAESAGKCDWLVFLDSDCTYEPALVLKLLARAREGFDIVTASPYHPGGAVEGVPAWRLFLSTSLSRVYRLLLRSDLYTFTAMVRVVRRDIWPVITNERDDFSFVTMILIKALQAGYRVGEVPAVLHQRKYGQSKMRVARTIRSHINIILQNLIF